MQAYVATYFKDPQLAKKDPAKIFTDDGGKFSAVMASNLTAEKFRDAYELSKTVADQVEKLKKLKRKRYTDQAERSAAYTAAIGSIITPILSEVDMAIPQITIFGMALLFEKYQKNNATNKNCEFNDYIATLKADPNLIWECFVELVQAKQALGNTQSWPTLLKSGAFYRGAANHILNN